MLNQTGVETRTYGAPEKNILVDEKNSTAVSIKVANTGVSANSDGQKIVKAGTVVYGDLTARGTAFTVTAAAGAVGAGVVLHDVDVTGGTRNSQCVISGIIDASKVDSSIKSDLKTKAANMKMIQVIE